MPDFAISAKDRGAEDACPADDSGAAQAPFVGWRPCPFDEPPKALAAGGITGDFDQITAGYEVSVANGNTELVLSLGAALMAGLSRPLR